MANLNECRFIGRLTRDAELKYLPNGTAVCEFGIGINYNYKTDAGEKREQSTFLNFKAWANKAEVIAKHVKKGDPLFIAARAEVESWDDKASGQKRSKVVFVVDSFEFLAPRRESTTDSSPINPPADTLGLTPAADDIPF